MKQFNVTSHTENEISSWIKSGDVNNLMRCIDSSSAPEEYRHALKLDLKDQIQLGDKRMDRTKALINSGGRRDIYGVFNASYFPSLTYDGLNYEPIELPQYDDIKFESPVNPVRIISATPGFNASAVVALFPENHIDGIQLPSDKIFYFIDKFVARHFARTVPILENFTDRETLHHVKGANWNDVEDCAVHWVWLHEYFHRVGPAPIPESLDIKSYRPLAGLEECRVDMEAVCLISKTKSIPEKKLHMICEFILAERLLRYSVEGIPNPNYDAIGSQVLVNFLRKSGYISISDRKLCLRHDYFEGLEEFVGAIRHIEEGLSHLPRAEVKERLIRFVNEHMNIPYESRNYVHDEFFLEVKSDLERGQDE